MAEPRWSRGPWRRGIGNECHTVFDEQGSVVVDRVGTQDGNLIAAALELYEVVDEAPILSKYHGHSGFETERFIADYEVWCLGRRAALAKARGNAG